MGIKQNVQAMGVVIGITQGRKECTDRKCLDLKWRTWEARRDIRWEKQAKGNGGRAGVQDVVECRSVKQEYVEKMEERGRDRKDDCSSSQAFHAKRASG